MEKNVKFKVRIFSLWFILSPALGGSGLFSIPQWVYEFLGHKLGVNIFGAILVIQKLLKADLKQQMGVSVCTWMFFSDTGLSNGSSSPSAPGTCRGNNPRDLGVILSLQGLGQVREIPSTREFLLLNSSSDVSQDCLWNSSCPWDVNCVSSSWCWLFEHLPKQSWLSAASHFCVTAP